MNMEENLGMRPTYLSRDMAGLMGVFVIFFKQHVVRIPDYDKCRSRIFHH